MNCNEFELIALPLARDQLMDANARERARAHADSCARCASRLASERFLIDGARAVVAEMATDEAPAHVEAALLAAFREQAVITDSHSVLSTRTRLNSWSFWIPAAAAALILIMISTMAVVWSYSVKQDNKELTGVYVPVPVPWLRVAGIEDPVESVKPTDKTQSPVRLHRGVSSRRSPRPEVVTQFYPLVEGEDVDSLEVSQVVRVELPASALSAAGVSVAPDVSTVAVKADVALGYDGLARAIRFVR